VCTAAKQSFIKQWGVMFTTQTIHLGGLHGHLFKFFCHFL
jgi:hypothetical protein